MNAKRTMTGLVVALGLFAVNAHGDDKPAVKKATAFKVDPGVLQPLKPADLAASEIDGSSAKIVGVVRNVGGQKAPAGRVARLYGKVLGSNGQEFTTSWVLRSVKTLPEMSGGARVYVITTHTSDMAYRLVITPGDSHPGNDKFESNGNPAAPVPQ